jgi:hypothetical protein
VPGVGLCVGVGDFVGVGLLVGVGDLVGVGVWVGDALSPVGEEPGSDAVGPDGAGEEPVGVDSMVLALPLGEGALEVTERDDPGWF